MSTLEEFRARIRTELDAADRPSVTSSLDVEYMVRLKERTELFRPLAARIISEIILPRVQILASFFANASAPRKVEPLHCTWWFGYCERFPASVKLDFSCGHDEEVRTLHLMEELVMVPSFTRYDRFDRLVQSLDGVDIEVVTKWVEDRLSAFLHAYLHVAVTDRRQNQALATDPVCHMRVVKDDAAESFDYQGHRFYFCAPSCREEFAVDPERFAKLKLDF